MDQPDRDAGCWAPQQTAAELAVELQRKVICFAAGDELYAGEWLTGFQKAEGAWDVCVEALRAGPLPTCDGELLQEFCSQTLARLARAFAGKHPAAQRRPQAQRLCTIPVVAPGACPRRQRAPAARPRVRPHRPRH